MCLLECLTPRYAETSAERLCRLYVIVQMSLIIYTPFACVRHYPAVR